MSFNIVVRNWEHYNRALGKHIRSKAHYEEEMKKGGFVSFEEGQRMVESCKKRKEYKPSEKGVEVVRTLLDMGKGDKEIKLAHYPKIVDAMKSGGMKTELPDWCPNDTKKGGFDNASEK